MTDGPLTDEERERHTLFAMMRDYVQVQLELADDERWFIIATDDYTARARSKQARRDDLKGQIELLAARFLVGASKHLDLPGLGRVQFRETPAGLRIADPEAFMAALGADERVLLVEQRDHLRVGEAKKYAEKVLEESGEVLPGVERTEAVTKASITISAPIEATK